MPSQFLIRRATAAIRHGGVIAYPTEAVYGLGCNPLDWDAVQRLLDLKQRPIDKGLILIASEFDQLRPFIIEPAQEIMAPVFSSWPGPTTWLLPAAPRVPKWLTGRHRSIAIRVTAHPLAAERAAGRRRRSRHAFDVQKERESIMMEA